MPGDPVVIVLGEHATDEAVNQLREQLHLNDSPGAAVCFCKCIFTCRYGQFNNMAYRAAV